jgi:8-oxo-dGTP pyrophosphatase MutT (NUDIX family)
MKQTTLCFLLKDEKVLLAMKKRGFGIGKWNGVGGKVQEEEDVLDAAIREIYEEIGVSVLPGDLHAVGTLFFDYQDNPAWEQKCNVFIAYHWEGDPSESDEVRPTWYRNEDLPFEEMWVDDPHWLPLILGGQAIDGKFLFDKTGDALLDFNVVVRARAAK